MGLMRFVVDRPELVSDWPELQRGFLSGFDQASGRPGWSNRIRW